MKPYPEMLTTTEVAGIFGVSVRTIQNWKKRGHLKAIRPGGGKLLFPRDQPLIYRALQLTYEGE